MEVVEDYYQSVDQENWTYTYDKLDSQTRTLFTDEEWYLKHQFFADSEAPELATMNVVVKTALLGTPW